MIRVFFVPMIAEPTNSSQMSQMAGSAIALPESHQAIDGQPRTGLPKWNAKRIDHAIGALLFILAAAAWLPRSNGPIDLRWDGGAYYLLGTSIAQGQGYRLLNEPGNPNSTLHPPLLPMFVAAHQLILGTTDPLAIGRALRVSACLLFALQALAIYVLLRQYISRGAAVLAVSFWVFHPSNTYFSDSLYAESLFGLTIILFFTLQRRVGNRKYFLLAVACALLAFLARTTGLIVLAAWAGESLLKRDFKQAVVIAAIALIAAGCWMGYIHHAESSPQYTQPAYLYQHADYLYFNISYARQILRLIDPFRPELGYLTPHAFARRIYSNIKRMPVEIGQSVFSWEGGRGLSALVALVASGGLILQITRKQYVISFFIVLSVAAMCITPFPKQFVRYLLPLSPLISLSFFEALAWLNAQSRDHFVGLVKWAAPLLSIALLALVSAKELRDERRLYLFHHDRIDYLHGRHRVSYRVFYYLPGEREVDEGLDWLEAQAGRDDVIAASDPQWVYVRTGLKSVLPPFEANSGEAQRLIDSVPVRYLFVDQEYRSYTLNVVTNHPDLWKCLWQGASGKVRIYVRSNTGR